MCTQRLFFENSRCLHCGTEVAFSWPLRDLVALRPPARRCPTPDCNSATRADVCESCALTRGRPQDDARWAEAETAKRRLLFELGELGLWPWEVGGSDLIFDFSDGAMTGHADGVVTLDLREVEDVHRTRMKDQLDEPYRTVLGHFRHEIGHFYQPTLMEGREDEVRARFGDERADYQAALDRHYEHGAPEGWEASFVSAYATMHPWEDWAETFAHFLHIRDVMQTASAWGLTTADPSAPIGELVDLWIELSYALNAVNRSLGHGDLYPYVLTPPVIAKLELIDSLVASRR